MKRLMIIVCLVSVMLSNFQGIEIHSRNIHAKPGIVTVEKRNIVSLEKVSNR